MNKPSTVATIDSTQRDLLLQEAAKKIAYLNASAVADAPVQEGDVSSSNPPILATELFGPMLEKLKGFLFVVNSQGRIVSVTDNITQYLRYQPAEWQDRSIYDFLHVANHAPFGQNLLSVVGDVKGQHVECNKLLPPFRCRMRQCPADGGGDKKRDEESLVHMQISSLPYRIERVTSPTALSGSQMYLICVAEKVENPLALYSSSRLTNHFTKRASQQLMSLTDISHTTMAGYGDFTTHVNQNWVIVSCNMSGLGFRSDIGASFVGNKFTQYVHNNDASIFQRHIESGGGFDSLETDQSCANTSDLINMRPRDVDKGESDECSSCLYRFRLSGARYFFVKTVSQRIGLTHHSNGAQIILSKHSIARECDPGELKGSASSSLRKAVIESNGQVSSTILHNRQQPHRLDLATAVAEAGHINGYMPNSSNFLHTSSPLQQHPGSVSRQAYSQHQQHQVQNSTPMTSAVQQSSNTGNLNIAMSGGLQLSDMNFNDLYSPTGIIGGGSNSFDFYENGLTSWPGGDEGGGFHQIQNRQTQGQHMISQQMHLSIGTVPTDISGNTSMMERTPLSRTPSMSYTALSRQSSLQQMDTMTLINSGNSGKLRELLSSAGTGGSGGADAHQDRSSVSSPADQKGQQADLVLRKLLQTAGDEAMSNTSAAAAPMGYTVASIAQLSSVSSSSSNTTTALIDSSLSPTSLSTTNKVADHQLLKKLLSDDPSDESDKNAGLLQKLLKDEEKAHASGLKKSPPTPSPSGSSSGGGQNSKRRFSSGSSNKDSSSTSKSGRWEDSGRGTKRKISVNNSSTITSSTIATAEPDSTGAGGGAAAAARPTNLLNQLLYHKTIDTTGKADPYDITVTPLERRQAQHKAKRGRAGQPNNVVDVVNDTIMLGKEQINMERFTSMIRTSETGNASNTASLYHRQNSTSSSYSNGVPLYDNSQPLMVNSMDLGQLQPDMMRNYNSNTKDYFNSNSLGGVAPPSQSHLQDNNVTHMTFQQMLANKSPNVISPSSSTSMLQQLLNPDADIIQELESLLGDTGPSMQTITQEDEMAIRDIEQQLLISVENLPGSGGRYGSHGGSESHSPGFGIGLADVPAPASNPVHTNIKLNISHKPTPPSISNAQMYSSQTFLSSPQHSLRGQLQQGMPRGASMATIRANQRARQNSGSGRPIPDGKLRRHSGNSPAGSMSPFSPLASGPLSQQPMQGNFTIPTNFGELMKSKEPPPNIKLPQDLNSNSFPPREMMHHELVSPRTSRALQQNYPPSPMDVPGSPTHFRFPDRYGGQPRQPMLSRQQLMGPLMSNQSYHSDQMNIRSNHHQQQLHQQQHQQQHMMMNVNNLHSPQGVKAGGTPMDTSPTLPPGHPNHQQQYNQVDQVSSNTVTSSQYVRNDLRAKIAAKAQQQNTSPKHQNFKSHQQSMLSQHRSMMSPPLSQPTSAASLRQPSTNTDNYYPSPFSTSSAALSDGAQEMPAYEDSVLPDDILDQITELTYTQNEIQQKQQRQQQHEHQFNALANSGDVYDSHMTMKSVEDIALKKIDQTKVESSQVRAQLRALAGASKQPEGTLDKIFRNQLTSPPSSAANTSINTDPIDIAKLKENSRNANVSIIGIDQRQPIEDLQPNDQRNSLLQKLLTDSPRVQK